MIKMLKIDYDDVRKIEFQKQHKIKNFKTSFVKNVIV